MKKIQRILWPFGFLYGVVMSIRNLFFDKGIFKIYNSKIPVISVGNLSMGGTGKTPHVDFLIEKLKNDFHLTILSRGYGRRTKGYLKATVHSNANTIGDEPLLYKLKHKEDIDVVVCEDRAIGAQRIEKQIGYSNLIILDDAYQHRKINRDINILLIDFNHPIYKDFVLPAGSLREFRKGIKRADLVIITKCPANLSLEQKRKFEQKLKGNWTIEENLFFSKISYGKVERIHSNANTLEDTLFNNKLPEEVLLVTGIANPTPLVNQLEKGMEVELKQFADHHKYTLTEIKQIHSYFDNFVGRPKAIVTTEKDYMRLQQSELLKEIEKYPWYYQQITVEIEGEQKLINRILKDVK